MSISGRHRKLNGNEQIESQGPEAWASMMGDSRRGGTVPPLFLPVLEMKGPHPYCFRFVRPRSRVRPTPGLTEQQGDLRHKVI